jgi:predicted metalloprotease with PDZ domain
MMKSAAVIIGELLTVSAMFWCLSLARAADSNVLAINVDFSDAPKAVLHAKLRIPVMPGPFTLVYPEWIAGGHRPQGAIENLVGLVIKSGGSKIDWNRDPTDPYKFHMTIPKGSDHLDVALDFLGFGRGESHGGNQNNIGSRQVSTLTWHLVTLYPENAVLIETHVLPSIHLPDGWKYATALATQSESKNTVQFAATDLETLLDSPVLTGSNLKRAAIPPGTAIPHFINAATDNADDAVISPQLLRSLSNLENEAAALFKMAPFHHYDFLLSLSDRFRDDGMGGQEHLESSDNRGGEHELVDSRFAYNIGAVLPHEYVHAWNGKYRRPAGEFVKNYNVPLNTDLIWVYEGLTTYLGEVLAARSGFWNLQMYLDDLADRAAFTDNQPGRQWRDLQDVSTGQVIEMTAKSRGVSMRRDAAYYWEGELLWMEVDVRIRRQTNNRYSLDDFCALFASKPDKGGHSIVPYDFDELVATLEKVSPGNWRQFLEERLHNKTEVPLGGIDGAGWRLVYNSTPSQLYVDDESVHEEVDAWYSLGIRVKKDGTIEDVLWGSPADKADLTGDIKIIKIAGQPFTLSGLRAALSGGQGKNNSIQMTLDQKGQVWDVTIPYHDGPRYPHLEPRPGVPDLIREIIEPRTTHACGQSPC